MVRKKKIEILAHVTIYKQSGKLKCSINIRTKVSEDDIFGNVNVFCIVVNSNNGGGKSLSDFGKQHESKYGETEFSCQKYQFPIQVRAILLYCVFLCIIVCILVLLY